MNPLKIAKNQGLILVEKVSQTGEMASLNNQARNRTDLPDDFEPPKGLRAVAAFLSAKAAHQTGLPILSMGKAYWTLVHEGLYILCVLEQEYPIIRKELLAIEALSVEIQEKVVQFPDYKIGKGSFVVYGLILVGFFIGQQFRAMVEIGRIDAAGVLDRGELWRAVTALTLHGDIVHLVSNCVAGIGFSIFVCRFFGASAGWFLILLSGTSGNLLNAWVYYPEPHFSIGASTAVFGSIGILTGMGVWAALVEPKARLTLPRWLVPCLGGLTLLGWLGMGDFRVDVAAHISGFLCGGILGLMGAYLPGLFSFFRRWEPMLSGISLLIIATAWIFAFSAAQ